ncbi:MAG: recombination mediator RecR [Phycisphaerales bacterium]
MPPPAKRGLAYPEPVDRLIEGLARLPGIGRRSAERMAFHILKSPREEAMALAKAVADVKDHVRHCARCFNLTNTDPCAICASPDRDHSLVLVVEQPKDLIALEQTAQYKGVYHVLLGRIAPLDAIGPEALTIDALLARLDGRLGQKTPIKEVVLGLNPTVEGDGTALYIAEILRERGVRVTRLARGLPSGGTLEHASKAVLGDAILGRQPL